MNEKIMPSYGERSVVFLDEPWQLITDRNVVPFGQVTGKG